MLRKITLSRRRRLKSAFVQTHLPILITNQHVQDTFGDVIGSAADLEDVWAVRPKTGMFHEPEEQKLDATRYS